MIPAMTLALLLAVGSQQQPENPGSQPGLQHRSTAPASEDQPVTVVHEGGKSLLPDDAYGLYRFSDREDAFGEGLQINFQFDEISGYFTVSAGRGKLQSYFLSTVKGGDGQFGFITRQVHGVSYSFDGKVTRGPGLTRQQDAFYLLDGTLTTHDDVKKTTQNRAVTLKLTAQH